MAEFGDHRVVPPAPFGAFLPAAGLFQGVDDFLRHVALVMLGEHGVGIEDAARLELAFGHHALPFAEQVGHDALIAHRDVVLAVGHFEADAQIVAALDAAGLDQSADANARAGREMLFGHVGRRIEKDDEIAHRAEHQAGGDASTPRLEPIRIRRRCLRVIALKS